MAEMIRVLIVEDLPTDADLSEREVRQALPHSEFQRVETREQYLSALESFRPDVILCDFKMPQFDGLTALALARERVPEIPFLIVTGSMSEDTAVECMKAGAWDYVIKEHLRRLGPAVLGGLDQQRLRRERKLAQEKSQRWERVFEEAQFGLAHADARTNTFLEVNATFARERGYAPGELVGRPILEIYPPEERDAMARRLAAFNEAGHAVFESVHLCKDGRRLPVLMEVTTIADEAGRPVSRVTYALDITERKQLEAQLRQTQRLEAVGRLAGGVAHDFNNLLTVINGLAELAASELRPGDPLLPELQGIQDAGNRAASLTRQLLAFARQQVVSPRPLDLNEAVGGLEKMLQRLIGEDIELRWKPGAEADRVFLDPSQVDQVLANLVVNARDAIPGTGAVTVETSAVVLDEAYCATHPGATPGEYAVLSVSDTGVGMDAQTLERIFEPFFTTKEPGKGTGLGLATVYGIVKQAGGSIYAYSEPGQGTTFRICLPRWTGGPSRAESRPEMSTPRRGSETVLLVEDEEAILELGRAILERQGYRVLTAHTPQEALLAAEAEPGEIHLLATDVVMPGMNGRELEERLRASRPGVKCLYLSGYPADVVTQRGVLPEGVSFLPKPYTIRSLAEKVREVLDG
ncbi:MAG: response regulator [Deltaproteobacteria bacterium]|nr:response regulator [Deltaproteobacteria bacterium]